MYLRGNRNVIGGMYSRGKGIEMYPNTRNECTREKIEIYSRKNFRKLFKSYKILETIIK